MDRVVVLVLATPIALELLARASCDERRFYSTAQLAARIDQAHSASRSLRLDAEIGWAPVLDGGEYDALATLRHGYTLERRGDVRRVVLLGDSVTRRSRVDRALAARRPDCEFWSAAVEGWNPVQEVASFLRLTRRCQPNQVVLVVHSNDFMPTPMAFPGGRDDELVLAFHDRQVSLSLAHYAHYALYRLWCHMRMPADSDRYLGARHAVEASVRRLATTLHGDRIDFSLVFFPVLSPAAEWSAGEREARKITVELAGKVDAPLVDLSPLVERELAAGHPVRASPEDRWHPTLEFGRAMACYLLEQGLLHAR